MIKQMSAINESAANQLGIDKLKNSLKPRHIKSRELESIDYLTAQAQLAKTMRRVCENDVPITIDGIGKDRVVLMPLEQFQKLAKKVG